MQRSSFTLFELVLVMFLIVAAASLMVPLIDSMMHPNQVAASIDAVRGGLEQARARAMEEGRPYRFSIVEGGSQFRIEPDDLDTNPEKGFEIEGKLPEPCFFVSEGGMIGATATASDGGGWTPVAVFLPGGTGRDDAELRFGRPGLMAATLRLRAFTGAISLVSQAKEGAR
jgi:hypothetical protein